MAARLCSDPAAVARDRARVVALARSWLGTPYCHQASCQGVGADCLGLVRGVWRALHGGGDPMAIPPYAPDWGETQGCDPLLQALDALCPRATGPALQSGQLLLFRLRSGRMAKHLGIVSEVGANPRFIHAYAGHGTVESPLGPWARRIAARFELI